MHRRDIALKAKLRVRLNVSVRGIERFLQYSGQPSFLPNSLAEPIISQTP
jgi:hypothetical protein